MSPKPPLVCLHEQQKDRVLDQETNRLEILMVDVMRVNDERMAREIAMEAAKSMWRYTIPSSFYEAEYDENDKCWKVEACYFENKLSFKIDAITGNVSSFKVEKSDGEL